MSLPVFIYLCNCLYTWQRLSFLCVSAVYLRFCFCVHVCVFSARCVDSETSAVRSFGDTWLRWKGQRVEYCHCTMKGRQRCHIVPVISECDLNAYTHKHTCNERLALFFVSLNTAFNLFTCLSACLPSLTSLSFTSSFTHSHYLSWL